MESDLQLKSSERELQLIKWLEQTNDIKLQVIESLPYDASFRRYYRVQLHDRSFIIMDCPRDENIQAFTVIAGWLAQQNLNVPRIYQADFEKGFLRLTDFGDNTYLKTLNSQNADELYKSAIDSLIKIQGTPPIPNFNLPSFNVTFMQKEWAWHQEWFLNKYCHLSLSQTEKLELDKVYHMIVLACAEQPQVFMHRDYHSANLMVHSAGPAILDFQDAFIGPVTYDLVSLLRDCYIDWPKDQTYQWVDYYLSKLNCAIQPQQLHQWFDYMGIQRHLKALMTFARKQVRDKNPNYLIHIPRTLNYIVQVSAHYPQLKPLHDYYQKVQNTCVP